MTHAYVATFYSFKGGVGRTTLLANVAHALAARGERVLLWDLDLEAPGIHHFPGLEPPERPWQSGFLEWLGDLPPCPTPAPDAAWPSADDLRALTDRVYAPHHGGDGQIRVLPAHGTTVDLGRAYARIDWHTLLVTRPRDGLHLFQRVCEALIEAFRPTFLFIDARTGISDLGGLLTTLIADGTVLVGNYSRQSTEGLRMVYLALDRVATEQAQADPRRGHRLDRLLVASPVPVVRAARDFGRARWEAGFPGVAPRSQIEIPLVESLLYAEDVLVRSAPSSDAARAYQEVAEALSELRQHRTRTVPRLATTPPAELEDRVARLLRWQGFELSPGDGVDWIARDRSSISSYAVTCVAGTVRTDPRFRALLERARLRVGTARPSLLIAEAADDDARRAAQAARVTLRTVGELEDQLLDLRACAEVIRRGFEGSELAHSFVELQVHEGGATREALTRALAWAGGDGPALLLVVGEDGSGKTSFLARFAYALRERVARDPTAPTPLLVSLRQVPAGTSLASLLQQHLRDAIGWYGNPDAVLYLLQRGRLVLLLDGFDEIAGTAYTLAASEQLSALVQPTRNAAPGAGDRIAVTCRTSFLRDRDADTDGSDLALVARPLASTLLELAPLDEQQIATFLQHRTRGAGQTLGELFKRNRDAAELARRPLMLSIMADDELALGSIDRPDAPMTAASLCQRRVDGWSLLRPARSLAAASRERIIERLAAVLWQVGGDDVAVDRVAMALAEHDGEAISADAVDAELRTAPFVERSSDRRYRFTHPLFLDYAYARYLRRQVAAGGDALRTTLAVAPLPDSLVEMFRHVTVTDGSASLVTSQLRAVGAGGPVELTANAARLAAVVAPATA